MEGVWRKGLAFRDNATKPLETVHKPKNQHPTSPSSAQHMIE